MRVIQDELDKRLTGTTLIIVGLGIDVAGDNSGRSFITRQTDSGAVVMH